ncbi:DUF3551 domain-containing protein [Bradyrhizobium sp. 44]|jgi:hypothetical protein|uniref:DUF3551 domain-containing protein n=1 Tax=unclassified Bradyrhizobium TaxID=2631580 RepID=UPI000489C1C5|nr:MULTISPECIES: DUF3551 domain-containing protein [unclassified Bradyrhizobium]MCK1287265.1 DUF3551 domain-containing protein [Bradyrhizobium sp. 44]
MMKLSIASAALIAGGLLVSSAPAAQAQEYRWCVQGKGVGYPGDCSFSTRAQCLASASGRNVDCGINPRTAYGRQERRGWR